MRDGTKIKLKQLKQTSFCSYLVLLGLLFYLSPILISDTGSAMFFLLGVFPAICFGCSVIYGLPFYLFRQDSSFTNGRLK